MAETASHARWKLVLYREAGERQAFPITKPVTTGGRDPDNDIQLDDLQVSRHHFRLTQQGDKLIIEDLGTANGTQVNGGELAGPYPLQVGDTVSLSSFTFLVEGYAYPYKSPESTRPVQRVPLPPPAPASKEWLWPLVAIVVLVLVLGLALALLSWRLIGPAIVSSVAQATPSSTPVAPGAPVIIVNQAPPFDSRVHVNHSITLQVITSDPAGINRVELWVNGQEVDEVASSLSQNVPSMTAAFEWTPISPGTYTLEIRAFNQPGRVGQMVVTTVMAIEAATPTLPATATPVPSPTILPLLPTETATPSPAPTETATPLPPTLTLTPTPASPALVVEIPAVNVRSGPGTQYEVVGVVSQSEQPEIVGQANIGQGRWWQIRFEDAPGDVGWVTADFGFTSALNSANVPSVTPPSPPVVAVATATPTAIPTATRLPTPFPTSTALPLAGIRAPEDKMLLIVENRSLNGIPARLTLSGGRSVGGGQEIDPPSNGQVELLLEPDFYRALWSSPANNFTRGSDFTAIPGKVMLMWVVPEDGVTMVELYDELGSPTLVSAPAPTAVPVATPAAVISVPTEPVAPPGKALLLIENRTIANEFAYLTLSEGNFGGGYSMIVDAGTKHTFEIIPDLYRMTWSAPAGGGMSQNREFTANEGDIILVWVAPENKYVAVELLGQTPQ